MSEETTRYSKTISQIETSYTLAFLLRVALKNDIFNILSGKELSGKKIAQETETKFEGIQIVLNALVANELLKKRNNKFSNSETSEEFLVKKNPSYLGDYIEFTTSLSPYYLDLHNIIKKGHASVKVFDDFLGANKQLTNDYFNAMHRSAIQSGNILATDLKELSSANKIYDVGGGTAAYPIIFCTKYPNINNVIVSDLSYVIENITKKYIKEAGLEDRIKTVAKDYRKDNFDKENDIILMCAIIHQEQPDTVKELFSRAFKSLKHDGVLVVSTFFIAEDGTSPLFSAMFGVEILATMPTGHLWFLKDVLKLLKEIGFKTFEILNPPGPSEFIIASKK